ncbi:PREDICTED: vascular endothelial growth factor A-A-like [Cyphomyrmex costatus]|uniref:vascular endothelial growth factor A-A-like n=1 Tax=Cyphomyrmex costatus TaxID=456900 RepID=UPI00085242C3|nr:PREDICTED: vascular endothelial growth factor A-A-like [Cyphomyrmex costatus]
MKFLIVVCALAITWIYTEGMRFTDDELRPHEGVAIGCAGRRMQLNHQMKEVMCVPRHTLVKLIPQSGYTFYPNYASVKRCSGFCPRNKSCMPVRKNVRKIAVRMDGYNSSECYHVLLEEHTKCKCQCSVTENHCNIHQVYSENNCACECKNKRKCDKERQMVWNEKLCKCTCNKEEEICTSGLEWVPSRCGCAQVMEMYQLDKSNIGYIRNL